jgi:NAD(P)-dependent dehydrogenase (short-subunit alcohol dehydrogenase family)
VLTCRNDQGHRGHRQCRVAGTDDVGRRRDFFADLAKQNGQSETEAAANFIREHRPGSLIQRFASVEEVANMVVYVSSKEASATNGAALRVEGGLIQTIA